MFVNGGGTGQPAWTNASSHRSPEAPTPAEQSTSPPIQTGQSPRLDQLREAIALVNPHDPALTEAQRQLAQRDPVGFALVRSLKIDIKPDDPKQPSWMRQLAHQSPVNYALVKASGLQLGASPPKLGANQTLLGLALKQANPKHKAQLTDAMTAAAQLRVERMGPQLDSLLAQGKDTEALAYLKAQTAAAFSQPEQDALWSQAKTRFTDAYFEQKIQARVDQENSHARSIYGDEVPHGIGVGKYLQDAAPHLSPAAAQQLHRLVSAQVKADWYVNDQFDRATLELYKGFSANAQAAHVPGASDNPIVRDLTARLTQNPDTSDDPLSELFLCMLRGRTFKEVEQSAALGNTQLTQSVLQSLEKNDDTLELRSSLEAALKQGAERYQKEVLNPEQHQSFLATGRDQNVKDRLASFTQQAAQLKLDPAQLSDAQLQNFIGVAFNLSPDDQAAFQSGDATRHWYTADNQKALQAVSTTLKQNIAPGTQTQLILGVASSPSLGVQNAVFLRYQGNDGQIHLMDQRGWDSKGQTQAQLLEDFQHGSAYSDDTEIQFAAGAFTEQPAVRKATAPGTSSAGDMRLVANTRTSPAPKLELASPVQAHVTTKAERAKTVGDVAIPVVSTALMPVTGGQSGWATVAWGGYRSGEQLYDLHAHSQSLSSQQALMGPWLGLLTSLTAPVGVGLAVSSAKTAGKTSAVLSGSAKAVNTFSVASGALQTEEQLRMMATQPMSGEEFALSFAMLAGGAMPAFMPKPKLRGVPPAQHSGPDTQRTLQSDPAAPLSRVGKQTTAAGSPTDATPLTIPFTDKSSRLKPDPSDPLGVRRTAPVVLKEVPAGTAKQHADPKLWHDGTRLNPSTFDPANGRTRPIAAMNLMLGNRPRLGLDAQPSARAAQPASAERDPRVESSTKPWGRRTRPRPNERRQPVTPSQPPLLPSSGDASARPFHPSVRHLAHRASVAPEMSPAWQPGRADTGSTRAWITDLDGLTPHLAPGGSPRIAPVYEIATALGIYRARVMAAPAEQLTIPRSPDEIGIVGEPGADAKPFTLVMHEGRPLLDDAGFALIVPRTAVEAIGSTRAAGAWGSFQKRLHDTLSKMRGTPPPADAARSRDGSSGGASFHPPFNPARVETIHELPGSGTLVIVFGQTRPGSVRDSIYRDAAQEAADRFNEAAERLRQHGVPVQPVGTVTAIDGLIVLPVGSAVRNWQSVHALPDRVPPEFTARSAQDLAAIQRGLQATGLDADAFGLYVGADGSVHLGPNSQGSDDRPPVRTSIDQWFVRKARLLAEGQLGPDGLPATDEVLLKELAPEGRLPQSKEVVTLAANRHTDVEATLARLQTLGLRKVQARPHENWVEFTGEWQAPDRAGVSDRTPPGSKDRLSDTSKLSWSLPVEQHQKLGEFVFHDVMPEDTRLVLTRTDTGETTVHTDLSSVTTHLSGMTLTPDVLRLDLVHKPGLDGKSSPRQVIAHLKADTQPSANGGPTGTRYVFTLNPNPSFYRSQVDIPYPNWRRGEDLTPLLKTDQDNWLPLNQLPARPAKVDLMAPGEPLRGVSVPSPDGVITALWHGRASAEGAYVPLDHTDVDKAVSSIWNLPEYRPGDDAILYVCHGGEGVNAYALQVATGLSERSVEQAVLLAVQSGARTVPELSQRLGLTAHYLQQGALRRLSEGANPALTIQTDEAVSVLRLSSDGEYRANQWPNRSVVGHSRVAGMPTVVTFAGVGLHPSKVIPTKRPPVDGVPSPSYVIQGVGSPILLQASGPTRRVLQHGPPPGEKLPGFSLFRHTPELSLLNPHPMGLTPTGTKTPQMLEAAMQHPSFHADEREVFYLPTFVPHSGFRNNTDGVFDPLGNGLPPTPLPTYGSLAQVKAGQGDQTGYLIVNKKAAQATGSIFPIMPNEIVAHVSSGPDPHVRVNTVFEAQVSAALKQSSAMPHAAVRSPDPSDTTPPTPDRSARKDSDPWEGNGDENRRGSGRLRRLLRSVGDWVRGSSGYADPIDLTRPSMPADAFAAHQSIAGSRLDPPLEQTRGFSYTHHRVDGSNRIVVAVGPKNIDGMPTEFYEKSATKAVEAFNRAAERLREHGLPVLPVSAPSVIGNTVVINAGHGVHIWESPGAIPHTPPPELNARSVQDLTRIGQALESAGMTAEQFSLYVTADGSVRLGINSRPPVNYDAGTRTTAMSLDQWLVTKARLLADGKLAPDGLPVTPEPEPRPVWVPPASLEQFKFGHDNLHVDDSHRLVYRDPNTAVEYAVPIEQLSVGPSKGGNERQVYFSSADWVVARIHTWADRESAWLLASEDAWRSRTIPTEEGAPMAHTLGPIRGADGHTYLVSHRYEMSVYPKSWSTSQQRERILAVADDRTEASLEGLIRTFREGSHFAEPEYVFGNLATGEPVFALIDTGRMTKPDSSLGRPDVIERYRASAQAQADQFEAILKDIRQARRGG